MDENTPLPDVVAWLPLDVAIYLDKETPGRQEFAVTMLKDLLLFLEKRNTVLDPLQLESVMSFIAVQAVGFSEAVENLTLMLTQAIGVIDAEARPSDQGSEGGSALHGAEGVQERSA